MKIDVEGNEYRLLDACPQELLQRCAQVVIEFHNLPNGGVLDGFLIEESWEIRKRVVLKLLESHFLVHLHGNNHKGLLHGFPEVVECLFIHKNRFESEPPVWIASSPRSGLDWPNRLDRPELAFDWWTRSASGANIRPRFALASLWTSNLGEPYGEFAGNKDSYCESRGYACHIYRESLAPERSPEWSKIIAVQRLLNNYEWVFWLDADAVIMNRRVALENLVDGNCDLIVACDQNGLNSGSFLIRNSSASREFLERVWEKKDASPFYEQSAMTEVMRDMPAMRVKMVPKRMINSYWNDYQHGDFILHAPGEPPATKIRMLTIALHTADS